MPRAVRCDNLPLTLSTHTGGAGGEEDDALVPLHCLFCCRPLRPSQTVVLQHTDLANLFLTTLRPSTQPPRSAPTRGPLRADHITPRKSTIARTAPFRFLTAAIPYYSIFKGAVFVYSFHPSTRVGDNSRAWRGAEVQSSVATARRLWQSPSLLSVSTPALSFSLLRLMPACCRCCLFICCLPPGLAWPAARESSAARERGPFYRRVSRV